MFYNTFIRFFILCILCFSVSACLKRHIVGGYNAHVYEQPFKTTHEDIKQVTPKQYTDSNGLIYTVYDTVTLHISPPAPVKSTAHFYLNVNKHLDVFASYSFGGLRPHVNYHGKGKLEHDVLRVTFFERKTKDPGLGGTVYDSVTYTPPLVLEFYIDQTGHGKNKTVEISYSPYAQQVDSLDSIWKSGYTFKTPERIY